MSQYELHFGMPLIFRESLNEGSATEKNIYASWRKRFSGRVVFLIGWCESAFSVVDKLGDYHCENCSGHPSVMFDPAPTAALC
ncbi:hypothetical protein ACR4XK_11900, partial [Glaesserella parasuis]